MYKKLGIVSLSSDVGKYYKQELDNIFGNNVKISSYSFENKDFDTEEKIEELQQLDIILVSTYSQYEILKKYLGGDFNMLITRLTLSKKGYQILKGLKNIRSAMLVNLSLEMAIETIGLLYALGIDNIEFTPVYPNMGEIPDLDIAITTGEKRYVPGRAKEIYDLEHRMIDEMTIVELFIALGLEEDLNNKRVVDYFDRLISHNRGVGYLLNKSHALNSQLSTLLRLMGKGLISMDQAGQVISINGSVEDIIDMQGSQVVGKDVKEALPEINFYNNKTRDKLVKINDKYVSVSIYDINPNEDSFQGSYAIIEDFEFKEATQNKLRLQLMEKGHIAKYTIDQIIGESAGMKETKSLIRRMAPSNFPVLITGESGTGKELVAQAIHNLSNNKNRHFVAVNCAAFNPSLLESELFGYEGGSFTGAMKEGKKGIFEMAHNGTLFLDEIGEMPLELQVKLLRAIQEGEIMRVGGSEIIKVDLRIISATNVDLFEEVNKGNFRKDLYYRLNVLPINIPPLREREEDIELLFDYFIKKYDYNFILKDEVKELLMSYDWDGNIRELINCIMYLENLNKPVIAIEDLPFHIKTSLYNSFNKEVERLELVDEKHKIVLAILYEAFLKREKLGRRSISQKAYENNHHISEYDVKGILDELDELGLVDISIGRGGTTISKKGIRLMERYHKLSKFL